MMSRAVYYFMVFVAVLIHIMIFKVKGQSTVTVHDCDNGDPSKSIAAELNGEEIRRLNKQVQSMGAILAETLRQMKTQYDAVLKSLETFDRRLREHNVSIKNQSHSLWRREITYGIDLGEIPILSSAANDWIVLMHRFDGTVNFYRNWTEYRNGFGDIRRGEFWIGNEKIHRLTNRLAYTIRIEVQLDENGKWFYADYSSFSIDSERKKYALHLSGYSGNAGDSLTNTSLGGNGGPHNGMNFTTRDSDNDKRSSANCAEYFHGAWWFADCWFACLTCSYSNNFRWHYYGGWQSSGALRSARMMIKST